VASKVPRVSRVQQVQQALLVRMPREAQVAWGRLAPQGKQSSDPEVSLAPVVLVVPLASQVRREHQEESRVMVQEVRQDSRDLWASLASMVNPDRRVLASHVDCRAVVA